MEKLISYNPTVSQQSPDLLRDLQQCAQMMPDYVANCVQEEGSKIIELVMASPQVKNCTGYSVGEASIWDGTGLATSFFDVSQGTQFILLEQQIVNFEMYNRSYIKGYYIRVTSGKYAGRIGYIPTVYAHLNDCN